MPAPVGRREANKRATRAALSAAAQRLFAERGFEQTTVRDIARAAAVTERTFYRYFDGKEGLLADEYLTWLDRLHDAIVARPAAEAPLVAVHRATVALAREASAEPGPAPLWLFSEGLPMRTLRRFEPRPLLRIEASIAAAILTRIRTDHTAAESRPAPSAGDEEFRSRVLGRVAIAALRSAVIRYRELRAAGTDRAGTDRAGTVEQLLDQAFAIIRDEVFAGDLPQDADAST